MSPMTSSNPEHPIQKRTIRVAILAEEPLGWGSGKHFFPEILQGYTWKNQNWIYTIDTKYLFDKDILQGRLRTEEFDLLIVPGGGVGDGLAMMKGFRLSRNVRKWKHNIQAFIQNGGGYVGICGGAALITHLQTAQGKHQTFLERQYHKSALGITCVSSYYRSLAFPLFYPFQKNHSEKVGAIAYVFSFAPGKTVDGVHIHSGGASIDVELCKNHPIFSEIPQDIQRIRWWGGPALIVPEKPDREVCVLARYPKQDLSDNPNLRIHAWYYDGGVRGLLAAFFRAACYIKHEQDTLKNLFLYTFYMASGWKKTEKVIELDFSHKPCITTEEYPNKNKGRIVLCTTHPEYLVWWQGHIVEMNQDKSTCLGNGLYQWQDIAPLSKDASKELTHTWWMVRRFTAWAAKVPDTHLPPIDPGDVTKKTSVLFQNIFWDGTLRNQMENI